MTVTAVVAPFVAIWWPSDTLVPVPVTRIVPPFCSISAWTVWNPCQSRSVSMYVVLKTPSLTVSLPRGGFAGSVEPVVPQ